MESFESVQAKVNEIRQEMKSSGWWSASPPAWVNSFREQQLVTQKQFAEWLQFIYLPNLFPGEKNSALLRPRIYVAPQAAVFWGNDSSRSRILQLLVELDALI